MPRDVWGIRNNWLLCCSSIQSVAQMGDAWPAPKDGTRNRKTGIIRNRRLRKTMKPATKSLARWHVFAANDANANATISTKALTKAVYIAITLCYRCKRATRMWRMWWQWRFGARKYHLIWQINLESAAMGRYYWVVFWFCSISTTSSFKRLRWFIHRYAYFLVKRATLL